MKARAYLLLSVVDGRSEQVARTLRRQPGVVRVDSLEGQPDVIVLVQAPDRRKLAEYIMPAISSIDNITEDLRLLVTRDNTLRRTEPTLSTRGIYEKQV